MSSVPSSASFTRSVSSVITAAVPSAEMSACFMSAGLEIQPSQQHIDNHKAYVQSWIQSIREKPDILIHAIKDAQAAANYMDYKAELITEQEYKKLQGSVLEVKKREKERGMER